MHRIHVSTLPPHEVSARLGALTLKRYGIPLDTFLARAALGEYGEDFFAEQIVLEAATLDPVVPQQASHGRWAIIAGLTVAAGTLALLLRR